MAKETIITSGYRRDLVEAHAATFVELGQPGDWLTAAERVATIAVVRAAREQAEKPPWYRPSSEREFEPLPGAAVDAAWRLTNHPGTLTKDWYDETVAQLSSPEFYVELMGIVAVVNAMDRLASILDLDLVPMPEPTAGDPVRPELDASVKAHWVPTTNDTHMANVLAASSVAPQVAAMRTRIGASHYLGHDRMPDMAAQRDTIDRRQIELLAGVTSLHNECFY